MSSRKSTPRLLGAAFLIVIVTSLIGGLLLSSATGSGSISDILVSISNNATLLRISILGDMATSVGVVALAVLLYAVLNNQNRIMALVALGLWLIEAIALAISTIGASALIPLSQGFVKAGSPLSSYYQTLGEFLYSDVVVQLGQTIHMFFYCSGGILWYYLFYKSKYVPRVISLYGLMAVIVSLAGTVYVFLGNEISILASLPIFPFELAIGAWLLLRGTREEVPLRLPLNQDQAPFLFRDERPCLDSRLTKTNAFSRNM